MTVVFLAECTTRSKYSPVTITRYKLIEVPVLPVSYIWDPDFGIPSVFLVSPTKQEIWHHHAKFPREFGIPCYSIQITVMVPLCNNHLKHLLQFYCSSSAGNCSKPAHLRWNQFRHIWPYHHMFLHCKKGIVITTDSLLLQIQMSEHNSLPCGELHDNLFLILSQLSSTFSYHLGN